METSDKILLGLLLVAFAAFPVAVFLYLRTAYRKGGWADVKAAAIVALVAMLIFGGLIFGFTGKLATFNALSNIHSQWAVFFSWFCCG